MSETKKNVTVLQTTDSTDGGNKTVREFTPQHAKDLLELEKSLGLSNWEKAPKDAKVTEPLKIVEPDTTVADVVDSVAQAKTEK